MTETTGSTLSRERAREAMMRFMAAWEQGDVSAVDEVFAEDVTYHGPPFPDMGRAELRDFISGFRTGFSEIHVQVHEHVVDGDHLGAPLDGRGGVLRDDAVAAGRGPNR